MFDFGRVSTKIPFVLFDNILRKLKGITSVLFSIYFTVPALSFRFLQNNNLTGRIPDNLIGNLDRILGELECTMVFFFLLMLLVTYW